MRVVSCSTQDTPAGSFEMQLIRETWGLGLSRVESVGIPDCGLYMLTSSTPVDRDKTVSRWLLTTTRNMVDVAGEDWIRGITRGVLDDWQIWKNKIHVADPAFCEADKELAEFRRWVKQFYSPGPATAPRPVGRRQAPDDPQTAKLQ